MKMSKKQLLQESRLDWMRTIGNRNKSMTQLHTRLAGSPLNTELVNKSVTQLHTRALGKSSFK